jgi:hypothetical protein
MNEQQRALNKKYETIAWGAFFIVWGLTTLLKFLPDGTGTIAIGLILLGLNAARYSSQLPTSGFTITLGVIALVLGGFEVLRATLRFPFELPVLAILLIVLGGILLGRELFFRKNE